MKNATETDQDLALIRLEVERLKAEKSLLIERVGKLEKRNTEEVIVTFYHPQSGGINTDSNPSKTATMTKPMPGRTIALSSELVKAGWLGCKVYIDGIGVFKAEDRMNRKLEGKRIDVCVGSYTEAIKRGKLTALAVKL